MKVSELIQKLSKLDGDATVIVTSQNFEHHGAYVEANYISTYDTGKKVKSNFTDAFDYESYTKTTYDLFDGDMNLVKIQ